MPPHGHAPTSPLPPTVADREAELAALQTAFDEYIASSRELEDELDAELTKMQEKLSESSAANAALASQLESVAPQLTSLEKALARAKSQLEEERELRRRAELAQDEAEARAREAEGSLAALREEHDSAMETMAFRDEEIEELRLELEVERERHREEAGELRSDLEVARKRTKEAEDAAEVARKAAAEAPALTTAAASASSAAAGAAAPSPSTATSTAGDESINDELMSHDGDDHTDGGSLGRALSRDGNSAAPSSVVSADYVKELETELEHVTEQLIAAEKREADLESALQKAEAVREEAVKRAAAVEAELGELRDATTAMQSEEREEVRRLLDEVATAKARADKYREELELANEELGLVQEEMKAAEEDLVAANAAMERGDAEHLERAAQLQVEAERARAEAREARLEADNLTASLRDHNAEEEALRTEVDNLSKALANAKGDHAAVLDEMEALRAAFDEAESVREGDGSGPSEKEEAMQKELMEAHQREVNELREELEALNDANAKLRRMMEELEASRNEAAAEAAAAAAAAAASTIPDDAFLPNDQVNRLEKELARAKEELARQEDEAERLRSDLEARVAKTEAELRVADTELESAKVKLAETTAKLVKLEESRRRMGSVSPLKSRGRSMSSPAAVNGVSRRLFVTQASQSSFDPLSRLDEESDEDSCDDDAGDLESSMSGSGASEFRRSHARSRKRSRHAPRTRARSSSPTSVIRLERDLDRRSAKIGELTRQVGTMRDQCRMGEAKVKALEGELRALREERNEEEGGSADSPEVEERAVAPATPFSPYPPSLISEQFELPDAKDGVDEGDLDVDEVLGSNDSPRIAKEFRSLARRESVMREKNAGLLQKILSLQGNIQVCCRIRPMKPAEARAGLRGVVEPLGETEVGCFDSRTRNWKSYAFDRVWGPEATQRGVFQDVEQLALSVVDGYNACIFAYGQTGSGKTYTMEGVKDGNQYGVSYRTIQKLFSLLHFRAQQQAAATLRGKTPGRPEEEKGEDAAPPSRFDFSIEVGMLEIYNDEVYDLLTPVPSPEGKRERDSSSSASGRKPSLDVRRGAEGRIEVPGLTRERVSSLQDVMDLLRRGTRNRASAATNLNEHSSRSHMILNVAVSSGMEGQPGNKGNLYLVDLAGSERVRKSEVEGKELREAGYINKSLSALGNVMEALDRKAKHVPYRDSKLTYLLQDSLGGNSRTMMVVTVSPTAESYDETQCALQFATRVRRIQLGTAQRNVSSKNLEETVKNLTAEMKLLAKAKERSEQQMMALKRENKRVQERLQSASEARAKSNDESRTISVLRKTNAEMTERWQKEKALRDQKVSDLENCQKELHRAQQQLQKSIRSMDNLSKDLVSKEHTITEMTKQLRAAKDATMAAKQSARRSQIIPPRASNGRSSSIPTRLGSSSNNKREQHLSEHDVTGNPMTGQPTAQTTTQTNGTTHGSAAHGGAHGSGTGGELSPDDTRARVLSLLERHDPTKVDRIDTLMERFRGREKFLLDKITARYEGDKSGGGEGGEGDRPPKPKKHQPPSQQPAADRSGIPRPSGPPTAAPPLSARPSAQQRSEMALARHKERMLQRKTMAGANAGAGAGAAPSSQHGSSLLRSKLNG